MECIVRRNHGTETQLTQHSPHPYQKGNTWVHATAIIAPQAHGLVNAYAHVPTSLKDHQYGFSLSGSALKVTNVIDDPTTSKSHVDGMQSGFTLPKMATANSRFRRAPTSAKLGWTDLLI